VEIVPDKEDMIKILSLLMEHGRMGLKMAQILAKKDYGITMASFEQCFKFGLEYGLIVRDKTGYTAQDTEKICNFF